MDILFIMISLTNISDFVRLYLSDEKEGVAPLSARPRWCEAVRGVKALLSLVFDEGGLLPIRVEPRVYQL